jgi:hypothetical protein
MDFDQDSDEEQLGRGATRKSHCLDGCCASSDSGFPHPIGSKTTSEPKSKALDKLTERRKARNERANNKVRLCFRFIGLSHSSWFSHRRRRPKPEDVPMTATPSHTSPRGQNTAQCGGRLLVVDDLPMSIRTQRATLIEGVGTETRLNRRGMICQRTLRP